MSFIKLKLIVQYHFSFQSCVVSSVFVLKKVCGAARRMTFLSITVSFCAVQNRVLSNEIHHSLDCFDTGIPPMDFLVYL